jgi:uncharacterized protein
LYFGELMAEYFEVLSRPKFSKFQDFYIRAEAILVEIETKSKKFFQTVKVDLIPDLNDNKILELADECEANFCYYGKYKRLYFFKLQRNKNCDSQSILG